MKFSRPNPGQLIASLGIALGIVMVIYALDIATTGDELAKLPVAIESIDPVRDAAQILSQAKVFVDLKTGYTGVLILNDVELVPIDISDLKAATPAGKQISLPPTAIFEPGNYTLSFQPTPGALIEKFNTGTNRVTVRYWKIADGPTKAQSFTWTFTVI
jgi:hypothetical protein